MIAAIEPTMPVGVPLPLPRAVESMEGLAVRPSRWRRSRGLIVDLDDTLYPRRRYLQSGFAAVAAHVSRRFGVDPDAAFTVLTGCLARGASNAAFQVLCAAEGLDEVVVPELLDVFRSHAPNIFLGRGAREMLSSLRREGWRLAVLTNGLPEVQERKVAALGLASLVDHVICAERIVPGGKPSRLAFAEALRRIDTVPGRTVCVGDDPAGDIAGARACGISTIRLALPGVAVEAHGEADLVVDMLGDVPGAARRLVEGAGRRAA